MADGNLKTQSFGQIQIIAKTLLIICGIFIVNRILLDCIILFPSIALTKPSFINGLFYIIATIVFATIISYFMVINNDWLVRKILPFEEPVSGEYERLWFSSSMRIGLLFCGLIFFTQSVDTLIWITKTIVQIPFLGREMISNLIYGSNLFAGPNYSHLSLKIYNLFKVALIIYLITGAPGFIGWQMKRTLKNSKLQGMKNE